MKINSLIALMLLISLSACEKALDYAINDTPVIVVNSFISPSEPITVNLSQSILLTEADTIRKLSNAIVSVYCDNVYKEELKYIKEGMYQSSFIPEANKTYQIKVSSSGLATASAQTNIPEKPKIVSFVVDSFRSDRSDLRAKITFKDEASIENYYFLSLKGYATKYKCIVDTVFYDGKTYYLPDCSIPDGDTLSYLSFLNKDPLLVSKAGTNSNETIDAILGQTGDKTQIIKWIAFSDRAFNGTTQTISLDIFFYPMVNTSKPIFIELKSINKDYYQYLKSKYSADNTNNSAFNEPIKVFNNITGGAGIFGAYNLAVDSVTSVKKLLFK